MFDSYFSYQTSYAKTSRQPVAASVFLHGMVILAVIAFPLVAIKQLPAPVLPVEILEAAPPPPPPPPGGSAQTKPKEEIKPKEPDALKEPDKPQEMPKPDDKPQVEGGMEGGVEGGVVGGVVGGVLSDMPAKVLVKPQQKLSGDAPVFPASARAQGLSATIAARICISAKGAVTSVKILRGSPGFNDAVERAVMTWRYEPYVAGSTATPACFPVYFNFNLRE
jgi:protein TonB